MIFDICDADKANIEWLPAHTARSQVGTAVKGNGQRMTADDWKGNNLADVLAKKGAKTHRVKWQVRRAIDHAEDAALRAALQLGITTHAANNVQEISIKPDGSETVKLVRDSEGLPNHKRKTKPKAKLKRVCPNL